MIAAPPHADFVVRVGGYELAAKDGDGFHGGAGLGDGGGAAEGVAVPSADFTVGGTTEEVFSGEGEGEYVGGVALEGG